MELECEWRHTRKRWSWEFEDFDKESVGSWLWAMLADSWVVCHWGRQLKLGVDCGLGRQTIESLPLGHREGVLCHRVEFRPWSWKVDFRPCCWEIEIGPRDVPSVGDVVSVVWSRKTFKNYLSPRVEEPKSEVNVFVPEQRSRLCICIEWFAYVYA